MKRIARRAGAAAVALAALLLGTSPGVAQSPHPEMPTEGPSSLPVGPGALRGIVIDPEAPGATGGLTVALYALQPDGTPGIGSAVTSPDGHFGFENLAVDPAIVYLVGVRYAQVPYGERTSFAPGQDVIDLALSVQRPVADGSGVRVVESSIRVASLGTRLGVEELHKLANDGDAPVLVPEGSRDDAARVPFEARLPEGATDFETGVFGDDRSFAREGDRLLYFGPVYPGEQELRFAYQLPVPEGADELPVTLSFPRGTGDLRVLTPTSGPAVAAEPLRSAEPREGEAGHSVQEAGAVAPGRSLALIVQVPETVARPDALSFPRAEVAVELDDTVMEVTQSLIVEVAPGPPVAGRPGEPLLRFELPVRAELQGLSQGAARLGVMPAQHGVEVVGPLTAGRHELAFRYRLPADPEATELDLSFPRTVSTLLVRAADTGLVIESNRLHRLRPQPIGTRTWMMREAFHVEPDEVVQIRFVPLDARTPSPLGGLFFVASAAAIVLFFVMAPLRVRSAVRPREADDRYGPAHERDLVYATIRDLEHDFETGKVAEEDYRRTRDELWARAKELMRQDPSEPAASAAGPEAGAETEAPEPTVVTGGFCPACGKPVERAWRFCSHCGGALPPGDGGEPTG